MNRLSDSFFRSIHEKARTLEEKCGLDLAGGKAIDRLSLPQIINWQNAVSSHAPHALQSRLSWFCGERAALSAIAKSQKQQQERLEGWIARLRLILRSTRKWNQQLAEAHPLMDANAPIPFQELLVPWAHFASAELSHQPGRFSLMARGQLERALLKELSKLSAACFQAEFRSFQLRGEGGYKDFVARMYSGGLHGFWRKYAALARLMVTATDRWIGGTTLLFMRFMEDYASLCETLFNNEDVGDVVGIESNLSAPHTAEGQVHILHFTAGRRLLYKPRSGEQDVALEEILGWINGLGRLLPHRAAAVVDRHQYFWQEFIPTQSCRNQAEVKAYYRRAGHLSALMLCLGSSDYHFGNLRACGVFPVLTDNETLFSARIKVQDDYSVGGDPCLDESAFHSIAHGHFLMDTARFFYPASSSIVGVFEDRDLHSAVRFANANTYQMKMRRVKLVRRGSNFARLNGKKTDPRSHVADIRRGFMEMMELLREEQRGFQIAVKKATQNFTLEFRMLLRPSAWYQDLLLRSLSPEFLQDGVDRSLHFERAASFYLAGGPTTERRELLKTELELLSAQLVPWFHLKMNQKTYSEGGNGRDSVIQLSGRELFDRRQRMLASAEGVKRHERIFDHYLMASRVDPARVLDAMVENLLFCYQELYSPDAIPETRIHGRRAFPAYFHLDEGISGVALLFAAQYHLTRDKRYKELVRQLLSPLEQFVHGSSFSVADSPVGAISGAGSVVNALCIIGGLAGDKGPLQIARRIIEKVNASRTEDMTFATGLSGWLHAVLKWSELTGDPAFDPMMFQGFERLFRSMGSGHNEGSGFAEGMPGMMFTACKMWGHFGKRHFTEEMVVMHHRIRDLLQRDQGKMDLSFHSGLAGWVLADEAARKVGLEGLLPVKGETAALLLSEIRQGEPDYFAYGHAGKLEALILLQENSPEALHRMMRGWKEAFRRRGKFLLSPRYLDPFFYRGISGILFQQLRYEHPGEIPSIWA